VSSKPAIIRQRDVTRIVKGYAAAGVAVKTVVVDGVPQFVPIKPGANDNPAIPAVLPSDKEPVDEGKPWHL
jgi:hypothetical protein